MAEKRYQNFDQSYKPAFKASRAFLGAEVGTRAVSQDKDFLASTRGFGVRYDPVVYFKGCPEILDKIFDQVFSQKLCLDPVTIPDLRPYRVSKTWQLFLRTYEARRPCVAVQKAVVNDSKTYLKEARLSPRMNVVQSKQLYTIVSNPPSHHLPCQWCHSVIYHISFNTSSWEKMYFNRHSFKSHVCDEVILKFLTGVFKIRWWDSFCGLGNKCIFVKDRARAFELASLGRDEILNMSGGITF